MELGQALEVKRGDVVAFVGAGGKTTAMFRLARELAGQDWRVITTTTTRVAEEECASAPCALRLDEPPALPDSLPELLDQHRHVFLFTRRQPKIHKVRGVPPEWLDERLVLLLSHADALLIEADGARRLPLKAPRPHEPALPRLVTLVVPVAGLDALGQPLEESHIYGADILHRITGHPPGEPVTEPLIAALLSHPQLGLKNIPPEARVAPLLNKITNSNLYAARQIADDVLTNSRIERVLIGAVREPDPIVEARRRVSAVILAAGESRRMGRPKLLLPWGDGSTIIREVCRKVAASGVSEIILVTGYKREEVVSQIADLPVRVLYNPHYAEGEMLSSLQVGLKAIGKANHACLVVLGDQPAIELEIINRLLEAYYRGRGRIVAPFYRNQRGHPILIDKAFWQAIIELPEGAAPRDAIRASEDEIYHVEVNSDSVLRDIDTPEDYHRAQGTTGG